MTPTIVVALLLITALGTAALIRLSLRLRDETAALMGAFDRTAPILVPLRTEVSSARESLAARLAEMGDGGSGTASASR
jgi:hypothetical protein